MTGRSLRALINQIEVGTLQEVNGLWSFTYSDAWLNDGQHFALSPHLPLTAEPQPDGATRRPVQWYFDNLLPEEGQRRLLASDAHLKNLSFLVSHEGVQLSPFYDLLSVACYDTPAFDKKAWPDQTQLAWPILGVLHFSDINRGLLLEAGAALNLAKGTADRLLESLRGRILAETEALYADVEAENARLIAGRRELGITLTAETRCLRAIQHTVIKEMARRLA